MSERSLMTRWKAGAMHLLLSLVATGMIGAFAWWRWMPDGLWIVAAPDRPLLLLFAVVVVVGPALTTLVYRPGKRTLRSDLIVVAALQVAFFAYAVTMLARSRPVFLVAAVDRFEVIFANDIDPADLAAAPAQYRRLPWTGPRLVGLRRTSNPANPLGPALVFDTPQQPVYYTDFATYAPILESRAQPLGKLAARSPRDQELIARALDRLDRTEADTLFVPVTSRRKGSAVMLIDRATQRPLRALPLDPWL